MRRSDQELAPRSGGQPARGPARTKRSRQGTDHSGRIPQSGPRRPRSRQSSRLVRSQRSGTCRFRRIGAFSRGRSQRPRRHVADRASRKLGTGRARPWRSGRTNPRDGPPDREPDGRPLGGAASRGSRKSGDPQAERSPGSASRPATERDCWHPRGPKHASRRGGIRRLFRQAGLGEQGLRPTCPALRRGGGTCVRVVGLRIATVSHRVRTGHRVDPDRRH